MTTSDDARRQNAPSVYTIQEAARLLRVSVRTVQRLIADGRLHAVQLGKVWRIPDGSIVELLRKGA